MQGEMSYMTNYKAKEYVEIIRFQSIVCLLLILCMECADRIA